MKPTFVASLVAGLLLGSASMSRVGDGDRVLLRSLGLTFRAPAGWTAFASDPDTVSLMRPAKDFRGPIQPRGQARIIVGPPSAAYTSVAEALRVYAGDARILSTGTVALHGKRVPCNSLRREILAEDVVPPENRSVKVRNVVITVLACDTRRGMLIATASAWEDDPQRVRADAVLLDVVRDLRSAP